MRLRLNYPSKPPYHDALLHIMLFDLDVIPCRYDILSDKLFHKDHNLYIYQHLQLGTRNPPYPAAW